MDAKEEIIDKYIERIKVDYPEDDKLMIDLQQFANEYQSKLSVPSMKEIREAGCINPNMEGYTDANFERGACYVLDYIKSHLEQQGEGGREMSDYYLRCSLSTDTDEDDRISGAWYSKIPTSLSREGILDRFDRNAEASIKTLREDFIKYLDTLDK